MKLNIKSLENNRPAWHKMGFELPEFDVEALQKKTREKAVWLHFGAGNIFRGFIAAIADILISEGLMDTGIVAAETFDGEIIDKIYKPCDNLTIYVGLKKDGDVKKRVIAGVGDSLRGDDGRLAEIVRSKELQLISFTITEKGYTPNEKGILGTVTELLNERYKAGGAPIALVSMDNCSRNGERLRNAVLEIAGKKVQQGDAEEGFMDYLSDEARVAFPWSMIDKITPRPDTKIASALTADGIEDMQPIVTSGNTYIANFVNAEIPEYLVIEDTFPNKRPPLEAAGVYMTDRGTVKRAEEMKVMTCLNPLHTALAVTGCLLGIRTISDEMKDDDLRKMVEILGYKEGLPVVTDPGIISPEDFLREVIEERLPNPKLPDTPERIATDTSQKLAIRFGGTIKAYVKMGEQDRLAIIPFVIAAWLRYLADYDDRGAELSLSPDPMLTELTEMMEECNFEKIRTLLEREELFGTNLAECGMADRITELLREMLSGPGAVRKVLHKVVTDYGKTV